MILAAYLCWLAPLTGCGDDQSTARQLSVSVVRVVDEADGSPVAAIKIVLMDSRYNIPVAGPFLSGDDGMVDMGILPRTDLHLMVFGGVEYRVHSLPAYGAWNPATGAASVSGNRTPSLLLLDPTHGSKSAPAPVDIQVHRVPADSLPRISGKVVSSNSGTALDQVFVSLSPYLTGYQMDTGPDDDVTGHDGRLSVSQIPFAQDPQTGNLIQISPLRFTRFGFRPVIWKYDPPNGSDNLDIINVTIEMEWLDYYRGVITGLLELDGLPAVGVTVGLGVVDQTGNKGGGGMPGWTEVTDEFGRFLFGQLPPGTYALQYGFALGDGVFFPSQPGIAPVNIEDRDVVDVGTLDILHEIEPVDPPHGAVLSVPPTTLSWTPAPGVTSYEVRIDSEVLPKTDTNSITLPESLILSPGLHYWYVRAHNESNQFLGGTEIPAVFRLSESSD